MNRTNIFVVAWDKPFIDKFANYTMLNLISSNNLQTIAKTRPLRFLLYTDRTSHTYFMERTRPLEELGERCVHLFEDTILDGRTIADRASEFAGSAYKQEIDRNTQFHAIDQTVRSGNDETLFVISQDVLITDGSLSYAQTKIDEGAEAVLIPMLRLSLEASTEVLQLLTLGDLKAKDICRDLPSILHPVSQWKCRLGHSIFLSASVCLAASDELPSLRQHNRLRLRPQFSNITRTHCHSSTFRRSVRHQAHDRILFEE
jgi:hypothetical protein